MRSNRHTGDGRRERLAVLGRPVKEVNVVEE